MLVISLRVSRILLLASVLLHCLALMALVLADIGNPPRLVLLLLLLFGAARRMRDLLQWSRHSVCAVSLGREHCLLSLRGGEVAVRLLPDSRVWPLVQVLRCRAVAPPYRCYTVLILPDMAPSAQRRQLRRFLCGWSPLPDEP